MLMEQELKVLILDVLNRVCSLLSSLNSMIFHDFFHNLYKFSMTLGLVVTQKLSQFS